MTAESAATANVLGAVALAVAGQLTESAAPSSGRSDSAVAALLALHHFLDHPTLDRLCQVLGLTHSGAVRLTDRLTEAGLVERAQGTDRRSRSVSLTPRGRRAARRASEQRMAYLGSLLADLSAAENQLLHELLGRVMAQVVQHKDGGAWICRMCDLRACGRDAGDCPAANAAAIKYGMRPPG